MKNPPRICRTCEFSFYPGDARDCFCVLEMEQRGKVPKHSLTDMCLKYVVDRAFEITIKPQERRCRVCGSACDAEMQEGGAE